MERYSLITGASSGIGKALAHEFARDYKNLILVSEQKNELEETAGELGRRYPAIKVWAITKDLTRDDSARELFEETSARGVFVNELVNDAGVGQQGKFSEIPLDKDLYMIQLNIAALTRMVKLFLAPMLEQQEGRILNLGSVAGFQPGPLLAVYHASKAYVNSLSEALAEELADTPITVTCLCPGPTATHFFERASMLDTFVYRKVPMMDAAEVASSGYKAFMKGERMYIPGASNKVLTFMRRVIPKSLQAKLNEKLYESVEEEDKAGNI